MLFAAAAPPGNWLPSGMVHKEVGGKNVYFKEQVREKFRTKLGKIKGVI